MSELKFAKSHEWARVDDGIITVGITDYAQKELGDIVFVELPKVGDSRALLLELLNLQRLPVSYML